MRPPAREWFRSYSSFGLLIKERPHGDAECIRDSVEKVHCDIDILEALILATRAGSITSREDFLDGLLDKGAPLI